MREILFRGRTLDDLVWAEGSFVHSTEFRGKPCDNYFIVAKGSFEYDEYISVQVNPETVGQYTGLTDKNGKKIFEGDIVKWYMNFVVVWQRCHYVLKKDVNNESLDYVLSCFSGNELEVIGNIHDNPELLKGVE